MQYNMLNYNTYFSINRIYFTDQIAKYTFLKEPDSKCGGYYRQQSW